MSHKKGVLTDTGQSAWQLAVIQLSGWTSLPVLATSILVLQQNSFYGAALTILIGNGLLWFIRLIIILMSHKGRQSTLDLSREYLGKMGGYCIGALCLLSALCWFCAQTSAASQTLVTLVPIQENAHVNYFLQISVLLGVASTLLCMNGMVVLRRLSQIVFPLLVVALIVLFCTLPFQWPESEHVKLSLSGLAIVMGTNLGITSDLPTFFRHSRSLTTSIVALTWIQVVSLALALGALFLGGVINDAFSVNVETIFGPHALWVKSALVGLVFLSVICANVANVYSASVGWEVFAPASLVGLKEYLILGLCLTTVFVLISNLFSVGLLLQVSDAALINLSIVFLFAYFVSRLQKRMPDHFEKKMYFMAWLVSSVINGYQYAINTVDHLSLLTGIMAIGLILFFSWGSKFVRARK